MRSPFVVVATLTVALVSTTALVGGAPVSARAATLPASSTATAKIAESTALPRGNVTTNGRTWKQSYRQDFTTAATLGTVTKKYPGLGTYDGFSDTTGRGRYAPAKVLSVKNGVLDFALRTEKGQPLVAAVLPDGYAPHRTGRVSIRYKTTKTAGYKFSTILWPSSDNWNEGEIDWPEADLGARPRPASAVPGSWSARTGMRFEPGKEAFAATDSTGYHVATTEWDKGIVRFYWDGKLVTSTTKAVPKTPFRVTLQAETTTSGAAIPASAVGHVSVDWVAVWN